MNNLKEKLFAAFQVEYKEHLEAVRAMLDGLEKAMFDDGEIDLVELHRRLHSLKGAARAVDLRPIEALSHSLENVIELRRDGRLDLDAHATRVIRKALDAIEDGVVSAALGREPTIAQSVLADVMRISSRKPNADESPRASAKKRGGAPVEPRSATRTDPVMTSGSLGATRESIRIDASNLDGLAECSGEFLTAIAGQDAVSKALRGLERDIDHLLGLLSETRSEARRTKRRTPQSSGWTDEAVDTDSIAPKLGSIGARARTIARSFDVHAWKLAHLARRLDLQIGRVRMVPADSVFIDARKIARDIAHDQGKEVRVDVGGLETLADRWVLQKLKDPVMHILRNAISHGIEAPDERVKVGKPREGRVRFDLSTDGARLVLRVEDDGRGIDEAAIRAAAVGRGLLSAESSAPLEGRALTFILTEPGFSTADRLTEVSGRGMGLSVVSQAIAKLQGDFRFLPRAGGGTVAELRVPLSVTSARMVLVSCSGHTYALPSHGVAGIHRLEMGAIKYLEGRTVVAVRGDETLPVAPLSALLGEGGTASTMRGSMLTVVELKSAEMRMGVVVDHVEAVRDGVVRDIGCAAIDTNLVTGGVVLESGTVVPVLNVATLVAGEHRTLPSLQVVEQAKETLGERSILVVDDSITARTLEKSVLEAHGYHVRMSVDGTDALRQLHQHPVDLVISDIEMPRMDGFELLKAIKDDRELAKTPVILVTSRSTDEDRKRGLTLGAAAYVVKQRFDQVELLETVGQLI